MNDLNEIPSFRDPPPLEEAVILALSTLQDLPEGRSKKDYSFKVLKTVDLTDQADRIRFHDNIKMIMRWSERNLEDILKEQRLKWYMEKNTDREKYRLLDPYGFKDITILRRGVKIKGTVEDLTHMLSEYKITVERNQITKNMEINNPREPSLNDSQSVVRINSLMKKNHVPRADVISELNLIADDNPVNLVTDHLRSLNSNGFGHIQELAECVTVESGTEHIRDKIFRMWMIMACAAADYAESTPNKEAKPKFNSIMIFFGDQGIGKTMFFQDMLPKPLRKYFVDGLSIDPVDKDSIAECIGYWVVEASEIDGIFKKIDISRFKAFLSKSIDILRRPYEPIARKYERRTVFVAATNEREFLKDYTGNRRYWPLAVEKIRKPSEELVDSAWCEAWAAYMNGEQWWPQTDLEKDLLSQVTSFQIPISDDPVDEAVKDLIKQKNGAFACDVVRSADIRNHLGSNPLGEHKIEKIPNVNVIGRIMTQQRIGVRIKTSTGAYWIIRNKEAYEQMKNSDVERYYNDFHRAR